MDDGVLVEVTRGGWVESRHRRVVAVVDAEGGVALQVCQSASMLGSPALAVLSFRVRMST